MQHDRSMGTQAARDGEIVLVLDAGTGSGRASLVRADGQIVAQAARPWHLPVAADGSQDLPLAAMAARLDDAVSEVLSAGAAHDVRAVATTSVRGAIVLLDGAGTTLWACGSADARARAEVQGMLPADPAFHAATGQKVVLAALPRLRWLARHRPSICGRVERLLPLDGWLARRLVGADVPASVSNASTTGFLDLGRRAWSPPGAGPWERAGDERFAGWLPGVAEAGAVAGLVSSQAAGRTGLPPGIPVAIGGGDTQIAALGLGCTASGDSAVVMGSHWQSAVTIAAPTPDREARFRVIAHGVADRWQADAIAWSAGLFLDWFVAAFGTRGGSAPGDPGEHDTLAAAAASLAPGAGGVLAVGGLPMSHPAWAHAAPSLLGFSLADAMGARPAAYRAIIEAGCLATAANLQVIADGIGIPSAPDAAIRVAGGASRSDLACQVLADVTGRTVARAATPQASVVGAAACAGVAAGWYPDPAAGALAVARTDRLFEPRPAAQAAYTDLASRWGAAATSQQALADEGVTTPVWRPAS